MNKHGGEPVSHTNSQKGVVLNRREALKLSATAGLAASLATSARAMDNTKTAAHTASGTCSTPRSAVTKTQYGPVRGFLDGGVFTFKGIPYGQTTAGENRWLPAKPPATWTDEFPALVYGANCPQRLHDWTGIEQTFLQDWDDGWQSEDMLKLNVWTPSLTGKRAVMVYFHGGGFEFGSAYELPSHEGAQMARHHDVVQVSVNHRLNVLGFLDLSEVGGEPYAESANVGLTDLVASLKWVRDNIANFGGDPDRVMIYGQSGGGSKVTCLMAMPSAAGLFHCASAQSGGGIHYPPVDRPFQSRELAKLLMVELGLGAHDIDALKKIEWAKLTAASNAAAIKLNPGTAPGPMGMPRRGADWTATVDGRVLMCRSFADAVSDVSKNVPMLVGSVSEEGMRYNSKPTEVGWHATLARQYGDTKATALIAAMKKAHPEKSIRLLSYGVGGVNMRNSVQRMVKLKHEQKGAPVYAYHFTWQSPMLEDAGAWHTAELAFCFDNVKRCEQGTGNTPEAQAVASKMAIAWSNFAKTGNPSQPGLTWTPADSTRCQTMIFDNECRMVDDPEGEARKVLLG
jgi:para-nitrobenzyl esterase